MRTNDRRPEPTAELCRTQQELEALRARYLEIFDLAPLGYCTLDEKGLILEANLTAASLLGVARGTLVKQHLSSFIIKEDRAIDALHREQLFKTGESEQCNLRMASHDDEMPFWVHLKATAAQDTDGRPVCRVVMSDFTERRLAGVYREISREVLQILNDHGDLHDSIHRTLSAFKTQTGCDAVGIRLQDGDDFPYFAQQGFSDEFLLTENTIIGRAVDGGVCQDKDGNVSLECICGLVISGKTDPANPLFTGGGSFWTNDSLRLLEIPPGEDPRLHPRNQCIHHGYASVALVPIRDKDRVVGLIQLNDRRKGRFTLEAVELLEGIASYIGAALLRKQAEEALEQTRQNYETFFNTIDEFLFVLDEEGNIIQANTTAIDRLGYTREELFGNSILMVHPPERRAEAGRIVGEMLGGVKEFCPIPIITKSGVQIPVETRVSHGFWDGKPVIFGVTKDISKVKFSKEKFSKLFYINPSACGLNDLDDNKYTEVNEAFCTLLGFDKNEVIGKTALDLGILTPETISVILSKADNNGNITNAGASLKAKNGDVKHVLLSAGNINVQDKKYRFTIVQDLTERKRVEEELNKAQKDLFKRVYERERTLELVKTNKTLAAEIRDRMKSESALLVSEEKYRNIFDNAIEGIYQTTTDGRFLSANPALAQKHGYASPEEMIASITDIGQQLFVNPQDRDKWMELLNAHEFADNFETQHYKKDGSKIWVSISARTVKDKEGKILYYEGGMEDITERIRADEETILLERQLRQAQKMEAIGTLAGGIAHDFNNILGAISGYTELTLGQVPYDSKANKYLKRIFTATRRAVNLVSQILAFSRQSEKELRPVRMSPIIEEGLKLIRATTPTTIDIHQNITAEPDLVVADETYIHQIFMNLCMNANHAMREKGGVLSVDLINESIVSGDMNHPGINPGPYLKLTVSDTGEGIEPGAMDKIFDPFFTTKKLGDGTGLGLSVVHGIVQSLSGNIKVDSCVGKGTSFSAWIPVLSDSLLENFVEGEDTIIIRGSGRILFVDDEEALIEMARDLLESLGYEVTARQDSVEALEIFRANPDRFDLVITDQTMPKMTGMNLAQEVLRIRPNIPIILCTGFSSTVNARDAKSAGIKAFILKPLIRSKISETIQQVLLDTRPSTI